ncbi:LytTR family DNA-binding domain-containing protein [Marinimicrobium sp. ABcell2]|uniref:LytR/AlgR family response regulator transcription factor n=1 Tax=Marinimicrobium sp. ABcell2 TaxID=3069751 RepID=UPI0027B81E7C|nr:LytTR family DNA-binding domain-containing protein [Marinimicrobium sp. ABcell2]MDQ2076091.1 LytTR family DNA-binding domain-containing protein [Marinimicrobium sp. ABcell2]
MSYLAIYCLAYTAWVEAAPIDIVDAIIWVIREWGLWLLLTPVLSTALRAHHQKPSLSWSAHAQFYGVGAMLAVALTLGSRVTLDVLEGAEAFTSFIYFLPRHLTAFAIVVLVWQVIYRPHPARQRKAAVAPQPAALCHSLLVFQGKRECLVKVESIDALSAAGNYVDIFCGQEQYLVRSSLKQLQQRLPADSFVQVHRSHLVNIGAIEQIVVQPAGNGTVVLRSDQQIPMSKGYRAQLKRLSMVQQSG